MDYVKIMELIFLISDLMVIAPLQYAKLKEALEAGTLTNEQVEILIKASESTTNDLIAEIDNL